MFKGLDHLVVAVKDIDASIAKYEAIYGYPLSDRSENAQAGMQDGLLPLPVQADSYVELVSNSRRRRPHRQAAPRLTAARAVRTWSP